MLSMLLGLFVTAQSQAQDNPMLLEQLKFTAVELLIYTDQLRKFDGTRCSNQAVSSYSLAETQQRLLQRLKPADRSAFSELFESDKVSSLLAENSAGIEAMLGPQLLLKGDALSAEQLRSCQELGAIFQSNYLQTEQDLERLLQQYRTAAP
jgi:hypothetical protein